MQLADVNPPPHCLSRVYYMLQFAAESLQELYQSHRDICLFQSALTFLCSNHISIECLVPNLCLLHSTSFELS